MAQERKKIERVLPPKPEPKKRIEVVVEEVKSVKAKAEVKKEEKVINTSVKQKLVVKAVELISKDIVVPEAKKSRAKASDDKYIRFSEKNYGESSKIISDRLQKGEIKYAYYAIDGDEGYHYFLINK